MYFTDKAEYFMTRGVTQKVPPQFLLLILEMLKDDRKDILSNDYFKVFKFIRNEDNRFFIVESQEVPEKEKTIQVIGELEENMTVWAISDGIIDGR